MKIERLVRSVEACLDDLSGRLLGPNRREELREEVDALERDAAGRRDALARCRAECDEVRRRLAEAEPAVALLPSQVESSFRRGKRAQAMRQALELEGLRRAVADDRAALARLEQACGGLDFHVRLLERRLKRLREELWLSG